MKPETKDLLLKLEPFAETHTKVIENFISKLEAEKQKELPQILKDKLDTIKNSPIDEPEIAKLNETISKRLAEGEIDNVDATLDILEGVYTIEELNGFTDMNINDLVKMGSEVINKVFGLTYEDENKVEHFKEIPSQMELQPLSYSDKRKVRDMMKAQSKMLSKMQKIFSKTDISKEELKETEKLTKEYTGLETKNYDAILAMCNLDISDMSTWEKNLLYKKLIGNQNGSYTPPLGKK